MAKNRQKKSTQFRVNTQGWLRTAFTLYGFLGDMTFAPMKYQVCFWIHEKTGEVALKDDVKGQNVNPRMFEFFSNKQRADRDAATIARQGNRSSGGPSLMMGNAAGYCDRAVVAGADVWQFAITKYTASEVIDILKDSSDKDYVGKFGRKETHEQKLAAAAVIKDWLTING